MTAGPQPAPRPVFLLGCPRSGTTLLRVMLNAHPHLAIPPENRFVMPAYYRDRRRPRRRVRTAAAAKHYAALIGVRGGGIRHLGTTKEEVTERLLETRPATLAEALTTVFGDYAARHGKPRWGDKRPAYYSFVDELDRMFPHAQFIHLVRDGRACVASLKRPPFSYPTEAAIATWLNAMSAGRRAVRRLGSRRMIELRYEDLIGDTEATLRRLCDFLGEPFDEAMLHPERVVGETVPSHFQQHAQIAAGVNPGSLAAWQRELSGAEVAAVEMLGRRHLRRWGYDLTGARPWSPRLVLRSAHRHLAFSVVMPLVRLLDRHLDRRSLSGRLARKAWRRFRPRRVLARW